VALVPMALLSFATAGCIIGEGGGGRRRRVERRRVAVGPDGHHPRRRQPVRRESAAKTLNEADPAPPADATLDVEPAPGRTPPPPVQ
jgi:hypothetical protein